MFKKSNMKNILLATRYFQEKIKKAGKKWKNTVLPHILLENFVQVVVKILIQTCDA